MMYVYDESYYNEDYLKTLNITEKTIMFKGSYVSQMGMDYEEVVDHLRRGKLIIKLVSVEEDLSNCTWEMCCTWNGNTTTFTFEETF